MVPKLRVSKNENSGHTHAIHFFNDRKGPRDIGYNKITLRTELFLVKKLSGCGSDGEKNQAANTTV